VLAGVIAAGVDEDIPAIVRRTDPEPVDAVLDDQLGQTHSQDRPEPSGHIAASRGYVHVWPGAVNADVGNRLRLLEDAVYPQRRLIGGGGLEDLAHLLAKLTHRDQVGFDPAGGLAQLGSVEELRKQSEVKVLFSVHHIEAVDQVLGELERKIRVMGEIQLTPYGSLSNL
jgi:hypothetical protein